MLTHIRGRTGSESWENLQTIADVVLAMAIVRTHKPDTAERVGIIAVLHACWEFAEPEILTMDIV